MKLFRASGAQGRSADWAFLERFEVPDYDHPERSYLTRYRIVQTPWFAVYVHRFDGPDPRPTLHDHPWNFVSLVLRGGYVEATGYLSSQAVTGFDGKVRTALNGYRFLRIGHLNRKRARNTHTIVRLLRVPTWTLMLVGRRQRVWGYVEPDGTWTRFDEHPYDAEFKAAMAARRQP